MDWLRRPFGQEPPNFALPFILHDYAHVSIRDPAVAIDEQGHWHVDDLLRLDQMWISEHDRVVDGVRPQIRFHLLPAFLVHGDADRSQALAAILLLKFLAQPSPDSRIA